ncbi:MAPEG family protein [Pseudovibrio sp. Ad5]|uniref:MAPEG family protein n=1 Tax=Pseudovibrio sp. Ad5 TaxID=989436 RepID=UPI0007AE6A90|nr:MAPEG family protein [Pseudovibrio sp. Ad5]KZK88932.1 MAPEG family protein [Pseudovibrio sp. Ad5]
MDIAEVDNSRATLMVKAYPFALIAISLLINLFVFGIKPLVITLPSPEAIKALIIAAVLLLGNHTWLMTVTELTRAKYDLATTPEEWEQKGGRPSSIAQDARDALERRHNAHRNTTENMVYFLLLAAVVAVVSPVTLMVQVWIVGFAVARLGYTYSYLSAQTGLRGLFMSLSLLNLYGIASYLVMAMLV